jgi:hypothetical protein
VLFLHLKFRKKLGFFLSEHCEWGTSHIVPNSANHFMTDTRNINSLKIWNLVQTKCPKKSYWNLTRGTLGN